jgi:hypothetical protein
MRRLFSSIHCYLDRSSGAALCTRELPEQLAGRVMDCRVLSAGVLDPERETSLDEVLAAPELPARRFQAEMGGRGSAAVIDLSVNGAQVTLMPILAQEASVRGPRPMSRPIDETWRGPPGVAVKPQKKYCRFPLRFSVLEALPRIPSRNVIHPGDENDIPGTRRRCVWCPRNLKPKRESCGSFLNRVASGARMND